MLAPGTGTGGFKKSYKVDIRGIDDDHFILISLLDELQHAVSNGSGRAAISVTISSLISYVTVHFAREERLMRSHQYPDYAAHKAQHDSFARRVLEFYGEFLQGQADLSADLVDFLRKWVVGHTLGSDRKLAPYLTSRGVR